ncbi:MAG: hypothetical protein QMC67_07265 [Candidatus Wallbacteria bacterium]
MKKIYLIGENIKDSPSPAIHNAALAYLNMSNEYIYELMPVAEKNFDALIQKLKKNHDLVGFNITKPYKTKILEYLDEADIFTKRCGACNVVKLINGRFIGKNTDGYGFVMPLIRRGITLKGKTILFFGAGGAARAAILQSINNGIGKIIIINRTLANAERLKEEIINVTKFKSENFLIFNFSDLQNNKIKCIILETDIIVNATSAFQNGGEFPVNLPEHCFKREHVIYDLSYYENIDCDFLSKAQDAGSQIIRGLDMLVYQGLLSFFEWTGKKPPVCVYTQAVNELRKNICIAMAQ